MANNRAGGFSSIPLKEKIEASIPEKAPVKKIKEKVAVKAKKKDEKETKDNEKR